MNTLSRNELKILASKRCKNLASVYMPVVRTGPQIRQNSIRFKNLFTEVSNSLSAKGMTDSEIRKTLKPVMDLLDDDYFWEQRSDGLSIFLSPEEFHYYHLPLSFEELVTVADYFHIKPLLPLFSEDGLFYVLTVSQNEVRLFQGNRLNISEITAAGVPRSMSEALKYDDPEKQLQIHSFRKDVSDKAGETGVFHGHGAGHDSDKNALLRYFRQIDKGLQETLGHKNVPLILAGVEYLHPIYREANTYPRLLDMGITGNQEQVKPNDLHRQAWSIVKPIFLNERKEAAARYGRLVGTNQVSADIRQILPAARQGRIDILFVGVGVHLWGLHNEHTGSVSIHDDQEPGDMDLLDDAAVHTLLQNGTVYAVQPEEIPVDSPVAAIFRY